MKMKMKTKMIANMANEPKKMRMVMTVKWMMIANELKEMMMAMAMVVK